MPRESTVKDGKKLCLRCGVEKDVEDNFFLIPSYNGRKYYKSPCKECTAERRKKYAEKYRKENRDKINTKARNRIKERLANGDKTLKRNLKNAKLKHHYGITIEEHEAILKKQKYRCKICGTHQDELTKGLYIDHCHIREEVRGLLCTHCNSLLGMVKDNPKILRKAISYLRNA